METRCAAAIIGRNGLDSILRGLRAAGRRVIGPVRRDGAICYDEITSIADLPAGWTDEQAPGRYRLKRGADGALFGYAVGPQSWKQFLHPPRTLLWRGEVTPQGPRLSKAEEPAQPLAFIGVRACELSAISVQDRVFVGASRVQDAAYASRRADLVLIAVNCSTPSATCFCASLGTGPRVSGGFDLSLTELGGERFLVEVGTDCGAALLAGTSHVPATAEDLSLAAEVTARATQAMSQTLPTSGLKDALQAQPEHPRWAEVAERCLACGNCTQVCPTCFCTTVEDVTSLTGASTERIRRWDSCFTTDFSYVHGGAVRESTRARYRQWLTHKLASWEDQFGTSGCVGCGRCVTWCPVGIDIREEARMLMGPTADFPD